MTVQGYARTSLAALIASIAMLSAPAAWALQAIENFDTLPQWVVVNNGASNLGYMNTNHAGGVADGEGGGRMAFDGSSYAKDVGSLDPSSENLSARGRAVSNGADYIMVGWWNSAPYAGANWYPRNFIGFYTYRASGQQKINLVLSANDSNPVGKYYTVATRGDNQSFAFQIDYVHNGGNGYGALTITIDGNETRTYALIAGMRDAFANMDRFGICARNDGVPANLHYGYVDDLEFTSDSDSSITPTPTPTPLPDADYPIGPIPGLDLIRGESVVFNGPQGRPNVFKFADGRICVQGSEAGGAYWSNDGGMTWMQGATGPLDMTTYDFGDGEIISFNRDLTPGDDGKLNVNYRRSTDDWASTQTATGIVEIPLATSMVAEDGVTILPSMLMNHGIVCLPNGTMLATVYGNYEGDHVLFEGYPTTLFRFKMRTVVISSTDRGRTWGNPVVVAYDTMLGVETLTVFSRVPAVTQEGFNEPDLTIAPNGDVICVMRSGGVIGAGGVKAYPTPLFISRSSDNGQTWTPPEQVADRGVNPNLVTLQNGVIVCSYSRPGAWLVFSDDNGKTWKGETQFSSSNENIHIVEIGTDKILTFRQGADNSIITTQFTVRKLQSASQLEWQKIVE